MATFDLLPTVEMEHPKAGRAVVTNDEAQIAWWRERGYVVIPGSQKGARVTIVQEESRTEAPGVILDAVGEPAIRVDPNDDSGAGLEPTTQGGELEDVPPEDTNGDGKIDDTEIAAVKGKKRKKR